MTTSPIENAPGGVGLRIAGVIAGSFALLLALLAVVRPEMSMMAMHRLMVAMGL